MKNNRLALLFGDKVIKKKSLKQSLEKFKFIKVLEKR